METISAAEVGAVADDESVVVNVGERLEGWSEEESVVAAVEERFECGRETESEVVIVEERLEGGGDGVGASS